MTAKKLSCKTLATIIAIPYVTYFFVQMLLLMPFSFIRYCVTGERFDYMSFSAIGTWFSVYTPAICRYGIAIEGPVMRRYEDFLNDLWQKCDEQIIINA